MSKGTSHLTTSDLDLFEEMLIADSLRGLDSTGVFAVDEAGTVKWIKVAAHPYALIHTDQWRDFRAWCVAHAEQLWGHNRKATSGLIKNENAHPFCEKHITLIHNGYVKNTEIYPKTDVDSEALAKELANDIAPEEFLKSLEGAYTLVWTDTKAGNTYIARNDERPLWYMDDEVRYFFVSEPIMLQWILLRNQVKTSKPASLGVDILYTISCAERVLKDTKIVTTKKGPAGFYGIGHIPQTHTESPTKTTAIPGVGETVSFKYATMTLGSTDVNRNRVLVWGKAHDGLSVEARPFYSSVSEARDAYNAFLKVNILEGEVTTLYYSNGTPTVLVSNLRTPTMVTLFNKNKISVKEWHDVFSHERCTVCNGKLLHDAPKFTSVKWKKGKYRISCPDCLVKNFMLLSKSKQDDIIAANGFSPVEWKGIDTLTIESESCIPN